MYDIFFISYNEPKADAHFSKLRENVASARRVHGIKGIHAAHRHCAELSRTRHFYVIDADNEILDYDFSYKVPSYDADYVHLWWARNPLNGLVYGWGGIKLFPKKAVLTMPQNSLDMTTSFPLKIVPVERSITHFNYSPFETWRSAFRECVKLTLSDDPQAKEWLETWTTTAYGYLAEYCLHGAQAGKQYALDHAQDRDAILKINDYEWLRSHFEETYTG